MAKTTKGKTKSVAKKAAKKKSARTGKKISRTAKKTTRSSARKTTPAAGATAGVKAKVAGKKVIKKKKGVVKTKVKNARAAAKTARPVSSKVAASTLTRSANAKASRKAASTPKAPSNAPSATSQDPIQFPQDRRISKTFLNAKELREFKALLLAKRADLLGDVLRISNEALSNDARGQGEPSGMPLHMADIGSDNWEQEFNLGLLANEEALVREIDDALERIADRTYGICLATGNKITVARLRAKPWARYCIEYARAREEGRVL